MSLNMNDRNVGNQSEKSNRRRAGWYPMFKKYSENYFFINPMDTHSNINIRREIKKINTFAMRGYFLAKGEVAFSSSP